MAAQAPKSAVPNCSTPLGAEKFRRVGGFWRIDPARLRRFLAICGSAFGSGYAWFLVGDCASRGWSRNATAMRRWARRQGLFSFVPAPLMRSVRATVDERTRTLPGDELIEEPIGSLDHAITIVVRIIHFIMQRRQLLGIARRAERCVNVNEGYGRGALRDQGAVCPYPH